jgi:hypothetical protein
VSRHQPECTCNARWGARHAAGCAALTPPQDTSEDLFRKKPDQKGGKSDEKAGKR